MGVDIRPYGLNKTWTSKIYNHWVIPTHCHDWETLYGILPNFNRYPRLLGLSYLRLRGRRYMPNLFKYDQTRFNKYDENTAIPKYLIGSNKFPSNTNDNYVTEHKFRKVALDMKLRPKLNRWGNLNTIKCRNRDLRRRQMDNWKRNIGIEDINSVAKGQGIDIPDNTSSNPGAIHHFTEEYYLPYLTKHYDFSLTHNDLCSIDKDHISVLVDMLNKYFDNCNNPELKLRHIELIDHTIHMNELFLFSFSKVFIQAKLFYSSEPKDAFVTEFIAFSKYPKTDEMGRMISEISSMIYKELLKRDLDTNARLIPPNKTPDISTQFTKLISCGNDEVREENINIKSDNLTNDYYPFLDINMLTEEYLKSDDKLLILHGENGSGKTKLSNILGIHLYNNKFRVIVCGGADINNSAVMTEIESSIYNAINRAFNVCVIIDDIEPQLLNRDVENGTVNVFFNKLLLMLDGNFDAKLKVIITTNHILKDDADEPLYRSGRMFDSIYIRYLNKEESKQILKKNKLTTKQINNFISNKNDSIKQSDLAQYIREIKNNVNKCYRLDATGNHIEQKRRKVGFIK